MKTSVNNNKVIYGLLLVKLDEVPGQRYKYVLAYGDIKKVQTYKKDIYCNNKIRVYKTRGWLVKRIEKIRDVYKDSVRLLYLD